MKNLSIACDYGLTGCGSLPNNKRGCRPLINGSKRVLRRFRGKLRDARERRGISLRQIANATKISIGALEALERNDISRLPGGIFSRAFVRSYASEVGLDPDATIQEFIAQFPNDAVSGRTWRSSPWRTRLGRERAADGRQRSSGCSMIACRLPERVLYFAVGGPRCAEGPRCADRRGAAAPIRSHRRRRRWRRPLRSRRCRQPRPHRPRLHLRRPLPRPAAPAPVAARASLKRRPSRAATADRHLSVKRPCWVSASVDGERRIERLLQPGEQQTIEVRREMVLTAGDASAIALDVQRRRRRGRSGKTGEVVTARFNSTNYKDYVQAR